MGLFNTMAIVQRGNVDTLAVVQGASSGTNNANIVIIIIVVLIIILIAATLFGRKK